MEYRATVDVADFGHDPKNGMRFLDALVRGYPELGPVVGQNTRTGTLTAVFSFPAADLKEAGGIVSKVVGDLFVNFRPLELLSAQIEPQND